MTTITDLFEQLSNAVLAEIDPSIRVSVSMMGGPVDMHEGMVLAAASRKYAKDRPVYDQLVEEITNDVKHLAKVGGVTRYHIGLWAMDNDVIRYSKVVDGLKANLHGN